MASKDKLNQKHQEILNGLLAEEANKYCADCLAKGPRWASWSNNPGVFICIKCAGIHRNLGVHISRVKSVTLDSWTPEQIDAIQRGGNAKAAAYFECNLPANFRRPQVDSELESFIRAKYERKTFVPKPGQQVASAAASQQQSQPQQSHVVAQPVAQPPKEKKEHRREHTESHHGHSHSHGHHHHHSSSSSSSSSSHSQQQQQPPKSAPVAVAAPSKPRSVTESFDLLSLDSEPVARAPAQTNGPAATSAASAFGNDLNLFGGAAASAPAGPKAVDKNSILSLYQQAPAAPAGPQLAAAAAPHGFVPAYGAVPVAGVSPYAANPFVPAGVPAGGYGAAMPGLYSAGAVGGFANPYAPVGHPGIPPQQQQYYAQQQAAAAAAQQQQQQQQQQLLQQIQRVSSQQQQQQQQRATLSSSPPTGQTLNSSLWL